MRYEFKKAFEIETGGEKQEITFIEVKEPSASKAAEMCRIEATVGRVIKSSRDGLDISQEVIEQSQEAKAKKKEEDEAMTNEDVLAIVGASGVDASEALKALKSILKTDGKLNGEFACSGVNYDGIPFTAIKEVLGFYIINFTDTFN